MSDLGTRAAGSAGDLGPEAGRARERSSCGGGRGPSAGYGLDADCLRRPVCSSAHTNPGRAHVSRERHQQLDRVSARGSDDSAQAEHRTR